MGRAAPCAAMLIAHDGCSAPRGSPSYPCHERPMCKSSLRITREPEEENTGGVGLGSTAANAGDSARSLHQPAGGRRFRQRGAVGKICTARNLRLPLTWRAEGGEKVPW